jgi:hypothetical protein
MVQRQQPLDDEMGRGGDGDDRGGGVAVDGNGGDRNRDPAAAARPLVGGPSPSGAAAGASPAGIAPDAAITGHGAPAAAATAAAAAAAAGPPAARAGPRAAPAAAAGPDESETEETDEDEDDLEHDEDEDEDEDDDQDQVSDGVEDEEGTDEDEDEDEDEDDDASWVAWFCALRGNEFFAEVDADYLEDDFNLAGLAAQVPYYDYALDMLLDHPLPSDLVLTEQQSEALENAAERLYGLAHARFVVTARGLQAVMDKYRRCEFGRCPR